VRDTLAGELATVASVCFDLEYLNSGTRTYANVIVSGKYIDSGRESESASGILRFEETSDDLNEEFFYTRRTHDTT